MIEKKVASSRKQGIWRVKKGFTLVETKDSKYVNFVRTST
ncbi:hypothetical protein D922_01228 [Enterococcus faecalis 06-MB-DW-09]|nr:hypothetical protein D922_01228 [Enterococcus faecalis 06-MB-DW-09]